jgi:hypothetical protein
MVVQENDQGDVGYGAVSVGVSTSLDADDASELLRHSDEAMYSAKRNGRARCESFAGRDCAPAAERVTFSAQRASLP